MALPRWTWAGAICVLSALLGCATGSPVAIPDQAVPSSTPLLVAMTVDGYTEWPALTATLHLDSATANASLTAQPPRHSAGNDQLATLALNAFLTPSQLQIDTVRRTETSLVITLRVTHPIPAPQLSQPASARNRADLGFAGRLLVLADVPQAERPWSRFYGDAVRANLSLLSDPDGYLEPRGLLPTDTFANTFPYKLLIDEARNNRIGVSNGGDPKGNYLSAVGGWQRLNLGASAKQWTGFGYLHAGQSATIDLALELTALQAGPIDLPLALLATHVQPTGGATPWQHRLPSVQVNTDTFAYRMPFGAIDCERVAVPNPPRLATRAGATTAVQVLIRDWDARAATSTLADLSREPDITRVPAGTAGLPRVMMDAPTIDLGGPITLELAPVSGPQATGLPGSELPYFGDLIAAQSLTAGTHWGLVQVTDAGALHLDRPWELPLAPDLTLLTSPADRPAPITWQRIAIAVVPASQAPRCEDCHLSTGEYRATKPPTLHLASLQDDSPALSLRVRLDGPQEAITSWLALPTSAWPDEIALSPWHDGRFLQFLPELTTPGVYQVTVDLDDGDQTTHLGPWPLRLLAPGTCPDTPYLGQDITTPPAWEYRHSFQDLIPQWGSGPADPPLLALAGVRTIQGGLITQGPDNRFWWVDPLTQDSTLLSGPGYPGSGWSNRALLLETDSRGRVFWVASNIDQSITPDPTLNDIYTHAGQVIHIFDSLAGEAIADAGTIDAGRPIVAMCIDEADAIWLVDSNNQLRHFVPEAGYTYREEISGGYSLGGSTAGGIIGAAVYDIDIDFHNHAFFLPVRTPDETLSLWRIECDGSLGQVTGQPNPLADLTGGPVHDAAIVIDNYGPAGQVLTGSQDAQLLLAIEDGTGVLAIATSDLRRTVRVDGYLGASRLALDYRRDVAYSLPDQAQPLSSWQVEAWRLPLAWR